LSQINERTQEVIWLQSYTVHIYGVVFIRRDNLGFKDPRRLIKVTGY
jgi:hypothetical protein